MFVTLQAPLLRSIFSGSFFRSCEPSAPFGQSSTRVGSLATRNSWVDARQKRQHASSLLRATVFKVGILKVLFNWGEFDGTIFLER
jgi:hypothetical protein